MRPQLANAVTSVQNPRMRETRALTDDWRFARTEIESNRPDHDDSDWEKVRIPHDWAISGPFAEENDMQNDRIDEDGQLAEQRHSGRTGGLPHVGQAWYRRAFEVSRSRPVRLEFDGVMSHSTVYVNGTKVGSWPYGYSSFAFDITDAVVAGTNTLAVHVDNPPRASRWYPGAGIYRDVRLVELDPVHIDHWGVAITTLISDARARVTVSTSIVGQGQADVVTRILDPSGNEVAASSTAGRGPAAVETVVDVPSPLLWSVDSPALYTAVVSVAADGSTDETSTRFGIRTIDFSPEVEA